MSERVWYTEASRPIRHYRTGVPSSTGGIPNGGSVILNYKIFVCAVVVFWAISTSAFAASVISDFDDGTLQGWTAVGDVAGVSNPGSGGNPGGYVRMVDQAVGGVCWAIAPAEYLGNWHGKVSLSADLTQNSFSGPQFMTVEFRISGPGGNYTRVFGERPPLDVWRTYGTALEESLWTPGSGTWDALLDNVTELRISIEFITGNETNGLDNVCLIDSSIPTTIGPAKQMTDGEQVTVPGRVTRMFPDAMYIQSEDRSAGIRVKNSFALTEGDLIMIVGTLATTGGERVLENATVLTTDPGDLPRPLCIPAVGQLGGIGATPADPPLGPSMTLKETGLLVRVCGYSSDVSESESSFNLAYGGASVTVRCETGALLPASGDMVIVSGVSASDSADPPGPVILGTRDVPVRLDANLIGNPGAEAGAGGGGGVIRPIPAWIPTSNFSVAAYPTWVSIAEAARIGGGDNFFCGGLSTSSSGASQLIDVSPLSAEIDSGSVTATLSAYLAGYSTQGDNGRVVATFQDGLGASLGEVQVGPQAGSRQIWVFHESSASVPGGTRQIEVKMIATRTAGSNNDAYFDNLSLVLTDSP